MVDNDEFMTVLAGDMPDTERLITCFFPGDPEMPGMASWKPHAWKPGKDCLARKDDNSYVTISSFTRSPDNSWRRRAGSWAAGRALMVDDVGSKVERAVIDPLPPTALIETSAGNFQAWYILSEPERDQDKFDALIRAFIDQKLLGEDPGMNSVTRVGRLPRGNNGKMKYGGVFPTRAVIWEPDERFTILELVKAYGLKLVNRVSRRHPTLPASLEDRTLDWLAHYEWLRQREMLKRLEPDLGGWYEMTCPWIDSHSNRADNGAAIRDPQAENEWTGAFRCHHGHCVNKGWRELTEWISEQAEESMEHGNKHQ